ncbi:flagellar protein FliS [Cohaesibacter celericrescens]
MNYALNHAIGAYRTANKTVAPTKAVTLLLDEILNALILASYYLRKNEYEKAFGGVVTASKVMSGLRQNVSLDADPELGQQFIDMYTKNIMALHSSYGRPDAIERYAKQAVGILEFRNAWAEISHLPKRSIDTVMGEILDNSVKKASAA